MHKPTVLIPIANHDFDPSEVALPWQILTGLGYEVEFATADGQRGYADPLMMSGEGLDPWGWIPVLKKIRLVGLFLRADRFGRTAYQALEQQSRFLNPKRFADLKAEDYVGLFLPGGHASRVRDFYDNKQLQQFVATYFEQLDDNGTHRPVAAVCHGVLLAARAISPTTKRSVLYGKKTTALTWQFELTAWRVTRFFARFWDSNYYRTYPENKGDPKGYWSVESEVKRALKSDDDFKNVPKGEPHFWQKTSAIHRDRLNNNKPAWVVKDGNYLSARWPGDMHTLVQQFAALLKDK